MLPLVDQSSQVGYLLKDRVLEPQMLVDTVWLVIAGTCVVDPAVVEALVGRRRRQDPLAALTEREKEVLGLVAEGLSSNGSLSASSSARAPSRCTSRSCSPSWGCTEEPSVNRRVPAVLTHLRTHA